jgi:hypothetical protein
MSKNFLTLLAIIAAIGVVSAILVYIRAGSLTSPADIAAKGLAAVRRSSVLFYGLFMPILVGVITFYVLRFMNARWPATAETNILWLAIGVAVVFTVMAAVVFKMRGFAELTALHVLYVGSFGWLLPRLVAP